MKAARFLAALLLITSLYAPMVARCFETSPQSWYERFKSAIAVGSGLGEEAGRLDRGISRRPEPLGTSSRSYGSYGSGPGCGPESGITSTATRP